MQREQDRPKELPGKGRTRNYSLCRSSCAVCPYHKGLLKLLDHGVAIVPTLPEEKLGSGAESGNT